MGGQGLVNHFDRTRLIDKCDQRTDRPADRWTKTWLIEWGSQLKMRHWFISNSIQDSEPRSHEVLKLKNQCMNAWFSKTQLRESRLDIGEMRSFFSCFSSIHEQPLQFDPFSFLSACWLYNEEIQEIVVQLFFTFVLRHAAILAGNFERLGL